LAKNPPATGPPCISRPSTPFRIRFIKNYGHVKALEELLGIDATKMHAAVVFRGSFEFKTPIPHNVFLHSCATAAHLGSAEKEKSC